jgi:hypothetical protein
MTEVRSVVGMGVQKRAVAMGQKLASRFQGEILLITVRDETAGKLESPLLHGRCKSFCFHACFLLAGSKYLCGFEGLTSWNAGCIHSQKRIRTQDRFWEKVI